MAQVALKPEFQSRVDRGSQFLEWIVPRLLGDEDEVETTVVMLFAQFGERYAQGIHDAAEIVRLLSEAKPGSRDLAVAAKTLAELEARTRGDQVTSL